MASVNPSIEHPLRVAIYCGSGPGTLEAFSGAAASLSQALVDRGVGIVYGGAQGGLMGVVADTALAAGGEVIGVMPTHLAEREIVHAGLTILHETTTMHERKARMIELADAFVALPGGVGTLEELSEVLSWARIGLHDKPVALLNTAGYYDPLLAMFDHMVTYGFLHNHERSLVVSHGEPERLVEMLLAHAAAAGTHHDGDTPPT